MTAPRFQLADELLRRLAAALRSSQLYSKGHPIIGRGSCRSRTATFIRTTSPPFSIVTASVSGLVTTAHSL